MLSKSQIKLITSLAQKKSRSKTGLFVVEGSKGIKEFLTSNYQLHSLYTTNRDFEIPEEKKYLVNDADLKKISNLKTAPSSLALFHIPNLEVPKVEDFTIALDGVRDPGNLGTIIRLCDWFGISTLICSGDTVDCYNPKVVQASMGSIARVNIIYKDLPLFLENVDIPVLGTFIKGKDIYTTTFPSKGILVLGNEANGISKAVEDLVSSKIKISQFGTSKETESLNVATATAIFLSEFRRQQNY